ncbi:MAG: pyridoxal phosphate-dependent decarboxylase family protein [Actinomycetota bacterium]
MSIPLEPDPEQRHELTQAVSRLLDDFYASLDGLPLNGTPLQPEEEQLISTPPPERGRDPDEIMGLVQMANKAGSLHPAGGHMAYIPNGGLFTGALGSFLASGLNRYTGVSLGAPGLSLLEATVLRWLREIFELPEANAGGVLLSGGSIANLTALVAARTARLPEDFLGGTTYATAHAHHSITKAARLAGFPASRIRVVPVDEDLRMNVEALTGRIEADRTEGLKPFLVVGSAGTTDSGAIDPLSDISSVADEQGLWFHVDAAYGGFFQLTERGRKRLVGIGAADSITLDPHKGLSIPFGVGALLVRDRSVLVDANSGRGAYLQDHWEDELDFSSLGPELTRPYRGMHVWLPLQLHGVAAFRTELDEALDLAEHAYDRLRRAEWVEKLWRPDLSIVAFRCPDDQRSRRALEAANGSGHVFLSSTSVDGRYVLRLAILNRRTELAHVDTAIDLLAEAYGR